MGSSVYVGLAVSSHVTGVTAAATFDNVSVTAAALPPAETITPGTPLADGWSATDIGAVGAAGEASANNGQITVSGGGADVWGTADAFGFAHTALSGDGTVVARVVTESNVNAWTKAGVMIRDTLAAGSRHAFMLVSPGNGIAFQRRLLTDGPSSSTAWSGAAPIWLKLTRSGNLFRAYKSTDGVAWTLVGSDSITMGATVYVGLAVSSHVKGSVATAVFDNVSVTPGPVDTDDDDPVGTVHLRVMHWNTHHGGYGTDNKFDIPRLLDWVVRANPDLISFNEVEKNTSWGNVDQPAIYKAYLEQHTGHVWYMVWAQEFGQWSANGKGNLIFSRFPWTSTQQYLLPTSRTVAQGQVMVNGRNITFVSTHLDPDNESIRLKQAKVLLPWESGFAENRILVGDMNAQPTGTTITYMKDSYTDGWLAAKSGKFAFSAADNANGYTRNSRIDYVFTSKDAGNLRMTRFEVLDTRDAKGVMPSDHRPIVVDYDVN
jgi:endonuclease/exonuclease/phosphatase family metal-dependent hydrolase/regulation of enolase protein 1 (concanavalin A-like superfamily)